MTHEHAPAVQAEPAGYSVGDIHPSVTSEAARLTIEQMAQMQAAGDFEGIARAISAGLFTAPALPARDTAPAPVATVPSVAPARDEPAEVETTAAPSDPWAPSVEQCTQEVCTLQDAAAICSGINPLRLKRAQMERHLVGAPSDAEIEALQARVTAARRVLESDAAFPYIVEDAQRVLHIEAQAEKEFRRARPGVRVDPAQFRRFRYAQPCGLRAAAAQLMLAGMDVHPGILVAEKVVQGGAYAERETLLRAYGGIESSEREALAAPDVSITLQDACIFALGGSAMKRREVFERLTVARMVPPAQPAAREAIAILDSAATDDADLLREAIDGAITMAPDFLPGLLADEQRIEREARAANNYARMLTSPDRRPPEYTYPVGERARRLLDAESLRRFFVHVAGLDGWAPPDLGPVPDTRSKFADVSPAVAQFMAMGASNVHPGAR